jgi:uncharacterized protein
MIPDILYPTAALRALALHVQGLDLPQGGEPKPSPENIYACVEQVGCVQIDTLQMVQRSHYLVLWSRLGDYALEDFDNLIYQDEGRRLFEGWQHAAAIVPICQYCYQMPLQRRLREKPSDWMKNWLSNPEYSQLMATVLERIREHGPQRVRDFEYDGPKRGSWWDWKPAKVALEHLYSYGDLMISGRVNFQRVYDLTERVLPAWVDTYEPSPQERDCFWLEQAVKSLGVCQPLQAAEYAYMKRNRSKPHLESLLREGVLAPVRAQLESGEIAELVVHRENLPLLERAADGEIRPNRTTFLSPFDSLFWAKGRDQQFWNFRNVLEAYKPQADRIWGYFCLPILHGERLVGRFDPKLERNTGTLLLKTLLLEPGIDPDDELIEGMAEAMRSFLNFHRAENLVIERSHPEWLGRKLMANL